MFDKSYHDSTNNENSSQSIMMFIIYLLQRNYRHGLGCRCIFYGMVLLRFHTICLYAKLIMFGLLIIFMFVIFRFKSWHLLAPLVAILNQNKLTRSNYVDWKGNLDIVLSAKKHNFVLYEPCPNFPSLDAPLEEK